MAHNQSTSPQTTPADEAIPQPNAALKRLDKLIGTWDLSGRTLDSDVDNIIGRVTIAWLPGGFFMEQRSEINFMGFIAQSLEVIGYDAATDTFPATVYSSMDGNPAPYYWDVQGDVVTHWTKGSKYTGLFSADGNILSGGWRPTNGNTQTTDNTYNAIMTRVK